MPQWCSMCIAKHFLHKITGFDYRKATSPSYHTMKQLCVVQGSNATVDNEQKMCNYYSNCQNERFLYKQEPLQEQQSGTS